MKDWLVLEDLPFDMILGSETCRKWQSTIDWKKNEFRLSPEGREIAVR